MRLFVAVTPSPAVLERLSTTLNTLRVRFPSARWVHPGGLHLTLAFLGERPAEDVPRLAEALSGAARAHAPFSLSLAGGGVFGRPGRPRVLWVGCGGDDSALRALQSDVVTALGPLGYVPDRDEFNAHLTLGRAKSGGGDPALGGCVPLLREVDFGESRIEGIDLYESRLPGAGSGGPRYVVVHRAQLAQDIAFL